MTSLWNFVSFDPKIMFVFLVVNFEVLGRLNWLLFVSETGWEDIICVRHINSSGIKINFRFRRARKISLTRIKFGNSSDFGVYWGSEGAEGMLVNHGLVTRGICNSPRTRIFRQIRQTGIGNQSWHLRLCQHFLSQNYSVRGLSRHSGQALNWWTRIQRSFARKSRHLHLHI